MSMHNVYWKYKSHILCMNGEILVLILCFFRNAVAMCHFSCICWCVVTQSRFLFVSSLILLLIYMFFENAITKSKCPLDFSYTISFLREGYSPSHILFGSNPMNIANVQPMYICLVSWWEYNHNSVPYPFLSINHDASLDPILIRLCTLSCFQP